MVLDLLTVGTVPVPVVKYIAIVAVVNACILSHANRLLVQVPVLTLERKRSTTQFSVEHQR
jgi:hypothetical protein